jgi:hypothetical protein
MDEREARIAVHHPDLLPGTRVVAPALHLDKRDPPRWVPLATSGRACQ